MTENTNTPTTTYGEPTILTANTYFWHPGGAASQRRRNESQRLGEVETWFREIGMTITSSTDSHVTATLGEIKARFDYSESCHNVYKTLTVTRAGKRSNIKTLRNLAK